VDIQLTIRLVIIIKMVCFGDKDTFPLPLFGQQCGKYFFVYVDKLVCIDLH